MVSLLLFYMLNSKASKYCNLPVVRIMKCYEKVIKDQNSKKKYTQEM